MQLHLANVSEWLRSWAANLVGYARASSNLVVRVFFGFFWFLNGRTGAFLVHPNMPKRQLDSQPELYAAHNCESDGHSTSAAAPPTLPWCNNA